ncbi:MAG TPA: AAA family ATPase [Pseudonocardiaceae bacterium]|nr:AAA family ATPase [Pseudonocardiaceae bacterium]
MHGRSWAGPVSQGDVFVGRSAQLRQIENRADEVRAGDARLVVIEGESGVGKTALLRRVLLRLADFRIWRAACDRSERHLPFEMLGQLVGRLAPAELRSCPALIAPIAAGLTPAQAGVQLLRLADRVRPAGPLAVVIDNVQFADHESVAAVGFLLRRLFGGVLVLLTAHEAGVPDWPTDGLDTVGSNGWRRLVDAVEAGDEIHLAGLDPVELADLVERVRPDVPPETVVDQLRRYTDGRPRAARALLAQWGGTPDSFLVPRSYQDSMAGWLASLPTASRDLVEALAVLDCRCPIGLAAQVGGVADPVGALEPLLAAGMVYWWPADPSGPVQLRDPLRRAAVYGLLGPRRRRSLHTAAAELVHLAASWRHRVAAAAGVDPVLAADLERAAGDSFATRDVDNAVDYLLWAADLSDARPDRERRLLTAVVHCLGAGGTQARVAGVVTSVRACTPSALRSCALGLLAIAESDAGTARRLLADAVAVARDSPGMAWLEARALAALAACHTRSGDARLGEYYARQALGLDGDRSTVAEAIRCLIRCWLGTDGPHAALHRIGQLLDGAADAATLVERSVCRMLAGELRGAVDDALAAIRLVRSRPVQHDLARAYLALATSEYLLGRWDDAVTSVARVLGSANDPARRLHLPARVIALLVAAGRGEWDLAGQHIRFVEQSPGSGLVTGELLSRSVAGAGFFQARFDYQAMVASFAVLREIIADTGVTGWILGWQSWWRPLLVEGLIGSGRLDEATVELANLSAVAEETRYLRVAHAWLSGWLTARRGEPRAARVALERGLSLAEDGHDVPLHRARLEQVYGQVLYSQHDERNAAHWLRRAHGRYSTLGARAYADRCAALLGRCGARPKPFRDPDPRVLTGREREVASFVARGMTNNETARRLHVTEKTVEYHLGNVYAKLGLTSRRQLRDHPALRAEDGTATGTVPTAVAPTDIVPPRTAHRTEGLNDLSAGT